MPRSKVPKFGDWDGNEDIPYTVVFNEATQNRGGNTNNGPQENPRNDPVRQGPPSAGHRSNSREEDNRGPTRQRPVRSSKPSAGSDRSFDRSPLHPREKVGAGRGGIVGSASPAQEGRSNFVDGVITHGTPGRSRLRPDSRGRGDEHPNDKGAVVPRFGEWDEKDPQSAENFTEIFNQVSNERNTAGPRNASGTSRLPSHEPRAKQRNDPKKCCFPWW